MSSPAVCVPLGRQTLRPGWRSTPPTSISTTQTTSMTEGSGVVAPITPAEDTNGRLGQFDEFDSGFSSGYWGFQLLCGAAHCTNFAEIDASTITLTATETQGPGLFAIGTNNLWYQGAHFVWNPPGDPWSIALSTSDPSGVCHLGATVDGTVIPGPSATPDTAVWQQCPNQVWTNGATVDTRDYVHTSGTLSLTFWATNAAGVFGASQTKLKVDNDPVSLRLGTPNDSNPSVWVGHAVKLITTAHAGPSGLGTLAARSTGQPRNPTHRRA